MSKFGYSNEGLWYSSWWASWDCANRGEKLKMLRGPMWEMLYGTDK